MTVGNHLLIGYTLSFDHDVYGNHVHYDFWIVKLYYTNGNIISSKTIRGSSHDEVNCMKTTADGGFVIAGFTKSKNGDVTTHYDNEDFWIVKIDNNGNLQWQKDCGGEAIDIANSIVQLSNGS